MAPKTYNASCHCGDITYTVTLPEPLAPEGSGELMVCNCSICTKNGNSPPPGQSTLAASNH